MKFYYNGQLIRTSKNHQYTHAVINSKGACVGCRTSALAAQQIINSAISERRSTIQNLKAGIKAMQAGKKWYECKYGRRSFPVRFDKEDTVDGWQKSIEANEADIEWIQNNWKVVELEVR